MSIRDDIEQIYSTRGRAVTLRPASGAADESVYGMFVGGDGEEYMGADALNRRATFRCPAFGDYGVQAIAAGDVIISGADLNWEVLSGDRVNDCLEWRVEVNRR